MTSSEWPPSTAPSGTSNPLLHVAPQFDSTRLILILTMFIYIFTGRDIYAKRRNLREFSTLQYIQPDAASFEVSRTTDGQITSQPALMSPKNVHDADRNRSMRFSHSSRRCQDDEPYTVTIESPKPSRGSPSSSRYKTDIATWAYTKVALLFFAALLITWVSHTSPSSSCMCANTSEPYSKVPATVNRIYIFMHAGDVSFPLLYIVALLLPLQGFWNAVIYIATSMSACRGLWASLRRQRREPVSTLPSSQPMPRQYIAVSETASLMD